MNTYANKKGLVALARDALFKKESTALTSTTSKSMLQVIAEATTNPACDVAKMRELLAMQKEIMADEARAEFTLDFMALQQELLSIRADGKIEIREKIGGERVGRVQQATPYAKFPAIMKAVKPLLQKHHFTLSFATEPTADGLRIIVKGFLDHVRGHQRTTAFPLPAETSGSKNNVQGWGSAMSYGKRYCTIALLNIISHAPEDGDRDGADVVDDETISEDQVRSLTKLLDDNKMNAAKFMDVAGVERLNDIRKIDYPGLVRTIEGTAAARRRNA